jgi:branched-subunit amino acid aminotransferase/4-amino-4-deoxychorismate lyase
MRLNGAPPTPEDLAALALYGYGHYTTMRVDPAGVRGLSLHLQRLADDAGQLFGERVSGHRIRTLIADYLADQPRPLVLRVTVFCRDFRLGEPDRASPTDVLVTSRAPTQNAPLRLRTVEQQRDLPAVKHVGLLPQLYARGVSRRDGADDALLVTAGGLISEGATWNVGFYRDGTVIWPDQPHLDGVTKRLLSGALLARGIAVTHRPVSADDLGSYPVAFTCNAAVGVCPVASIDGHSFDLSGLGVLTDAYNAIPMDPL